MCRLDVGAQIDRWDLGVVDEIYLFRAGINVFLQITTCISASSAIGTGLSEAEPRQNAFG